MGNGIQKPWVQWVQPSTLVVVLGVVIVTWADVRHLMSDAQTHDRFHDKVTRFMEGNGGNRFTREDGYKLEKSIKEWTAANYPPPPLEEKVDDLTAGQKMLQANQAVMQRDIALIKAALEAK